MGEKKKGEKKKKKDYFINPTSPSPSLPSLSPPASSSLFLFFPAVDSLAGEGGEREREGERTIEWTLRGKGKSARMISSMIFLGESGEKERKKERKKKKEKEKKKKKKIGGENYFLRTKSTKHPNYYYCLPF